MSQQPSHEEVQGMLASDAMPIIPGPEWEGLCAHLCECEACRGDLAALRPDVALLFALPPVVAVDPIRKQRVRARLLARVSAEAAPFSSDPDASPGTTRALPRGRTSPWTGWAVAAGMAALLLTHHTFHRPLAFGWVAAAVLGLLLVGVGVYAMEQRKQVAALRDQLSAAKREQQGLHSRAEHRVPVRQ